MINLARKLSGGKSRRRKISRDYNGPTSILKKKRSSEEVKCHAVSSSESIDWDIEVDCKEVGMDIYEDEEVVKSRTQKEFNTPVIKSHHEDGNVFVNFLVYFATEHEILLQVIIILPLVLMVLYIVFVEDSQIFHVSI